MEKTKIRLYLLYLWTSLLNHTDQTSGITDPSRHNASNGIKQIKITSQESHKQKPFSVLLALQNKSCQKYFVLPGNH